MGRTLLLPGKKLRRTGFVPSPLPRSRAVPSGRAGTACSWRCPGASSLCSLSGKGRSAPTRLLDFVPFVPGTFSSPPRKARVLPREQQTVSSLQVVIDNLQSTGSQMADNSCVPTKKRCACAVKTMSSEERLHRASWLLWCDGGICRREHVRTFCCCSEADP
jgi:hypothetical protein